MYSYSVTDTGLVRSSNQDYYFASDSPVGNLPNLYIVADGMGGHKAGEYASRFTVDRVLASCSRTSLTEPIAILREAIEKANEILLRESASDESKSGMGTTLVLATVFEDKALVANVGDSRLYQIDTDITQITKDHSLVQEMVQAGELAAEEARSHENKNIITRAIGANQKVEPDFFEIDVKKGDHLLLCTDGLTNMVEDDVIFHILSSQKKLADRAKALIAMANQNGGRDNITALIVEVE